MENKISWKVILTFVGAINAYLIGSGFASGQEALQYFAAYGTWGALGAIIITVVIYVWFSSTIMVDGHKLKLASSNEIFRYYCGKYLGTIYEVYIPIFLSMVVMIMISGAGAVLSEYYGLHAQVGRVAMAAAALTTVALGLSRLLSIVSKLGPAIIAFGLIVATGNIAMNPSGLLHANEAMQTLEMRKAAPHWAVSGLIFPALGCLMIAPFLASISVKANSTKEAKIGGLLGGFVFALAVCVMSYGILATIDDLYNKDIPTLVMARNLFPGSVGIIFSVILLAGIYTTAVPMLWITCNSLIPDETSRRFKMLAATLTVLAFFGSQASFAELVNIIYPLSGYLGLLLIACILIKKITAISRRN